MGINVNAPKGSVLAVIELGNLFKKKKAEVENPIRPDEIEKFVADNINSFLEHWNAVGGFENEEPMSDIVEQWYQKQFETVTCPLCENDMEYKRYGTEPNNFQKETHAWLCTECPGVLFEYHVDANIEMLKKLV